MSRAIEVRENIWLHKSDIEREHHGRADSAELIDDCWEALTTRSSRLRLSSERGLKTTGELVAARIRASASSNPTEAELRRVIEQQSAAIDRLLAFVPPRARDIDAERLQEITREVARLAARAFEGEHVFVSTSEELDDDCLARYRLLIDIEAGDDFNASAFVTKSVELQREITRMLDPEEYRAVRIFVEPVV